MSKTKKCSNTCADCKCKKDKRDQSSKAFKAYIEKNPSALESLIYDV